MIDRLSTIGTFALVLALSLGGCSDTSTSRDQIKIVGSSTVYPFTTSVAEAFVNANPNMKAPVVESTGSGAGFRLFCAGIGPEHPDINDASRRMTRAEFDQCTRNGVQGIMEVQIGSDGIVLAQSNGGPAMRLTQQDLYRALSAEPLGKPNSAKRWHDVNPTLPDIPIQVYGPPSTSGTRDAFAELILAQGCEQADPGALKIKTSAPHDYEQRCARIRDDGPYIDSGENDNLIVQKLAGNANAIGIFGYSYLDENQDRIRAISINGVLPTYNSILLGQYPGARPLFLYVKLQHLNAVRGLRDFLAQYATMWAKDGPLMKRGLIAASPDVLQRSAEIIERGIALDPAQLQ